jgi:hypothetical protein
MLSTSSETGATLRELMECMGHRSTRGALIYLHARDQRDRAIADGLDTIVDPSRHPTDRECDRHDRHAGGTKQRQPSANVHIRRTASPLPAKTRGAGDRDRTGMASLEGRAVIMVLTSTMLTCGYPETDDSTDRC